MVRNEFFKNITFYVNLCFYVPMWLIFFEMKFAAISQ